MATNTPNYNLVKPDYNEFADVSVLNENADKIDQALTENKEEIEAVLNTFNEWNENEYVPTIETLQAKTQVATTAEAQAGTNNAKIMTPKTVGEVITNKTLPKTGGTLTGDVLINKSGGKVGFSSDNGIKTGAVVFNANDTTSYGFDIRVQDVNAMTIQSDTSILIKNSVTGGLHNLITEVSRKIYGSIESDPNEDMRTFFMTNHVNAQSKGSNVYWYIDNVFYSNSANRAQIARTYNGTVADFKVRHYYDGIGWSPWSPSLQSLDSTITGVQNNLANKITATATTPTTAIANGNFVGVYV